MEFGICFKGFVQPARARALVRLAESAGFTYCWFYDSHILWRESFAQMAMCMEHTTKMRFGPCVTNPNTRDWSLAASMFGSLALQSEGRFDIGVGRGDSAVRVMGRKPANLARMEQFILDVKAMCSEAKSIPEIIKDSHPHFSYFHCNDENLKGPGFGNVDFLPIFKSLKEVNYDGFASVEVFDFEEGPEKIAQASLSYMKEILTKI
jgi:alkanesulfonate monooxygenase SsuD/methylene tetrahydromethanopterin reductase-like flavin-dependent oxidoreductase (luciferase family)